MKIIFGIFAHPDDEAFGPAGTLLKATRAGNELHLITLTAGEGGTNPDNVPNLAEVRLKEWEQSGELLGATHMECFDYRDGRLCNNDMVEVSERVIQYVQRVLETAPSNASIEFMAFDLTGITGHIDHIVASRAACHAFYSLKKTDARMHRLRLYCQPQEIVPVQTADWIYSEAGRSSDEIDEVIDARDLLPDILEVMKAHHSQRSDFGYNLKQQGENLGRNCFIIKT